MLGTNTLSSSQIGLIRMALGTSLSAGEKGSTLATKPLS